MTKLLYPEDGIYRLIKDEVYQLQEHLSNGLKYTDFNIPSSFYYKYYLNNLDNTLIAYKNELTSILEAAQKVNQNFEILEMDLNIKIKTLDNKKMQERERMIL